MSHIWYNDGNNCWEITSQNYIDSPSQKSRMQENQTPMQHELIESVSVTLSSRITRFFLSASPRICKKEQGRSLFDNSAADLMQRALMN